MSQKTHLCLQMGDLHPVNEMKRHINILFGDDITMKYDISKISWSISNKINYLITHCKVCTNYNCLRCTLRGIINQANIILKKNIEQLTTDEEDKIMYVIEELYVILNKTAGGTLEKDNTTCIFYGYAKKCTQEVHEVDEVDEVNKVLGDDVLKLNVGRTFDFKDDSIMKKRKLPTVPNWEMLDVHKIEDTDDSTGYNSADDLYT